MIDSPAHRVAVILAVWLVTLAIVATIYVTTMGDVAEARGEDRHLYRVNFEGQSS